MTAFLNVTVIGSPMDRDAVVKDGTRVAINADMIVSYGPSKFKGATRIVIGTQLFHVYEPVAQIEKLFRLWNFKINPWKPAAKEQWQLNNASVTSLTNPPGDSKPVEFSAFSNQEE